MNGLKNLFKVKNNIINYLQTFTIILLTAKFVYFMLYNTVMYKQIKVKRKNEHSKKTKN